MTVLTQRVILNTTRRVINTLRLLETILMGLIRKTTLLFAGITFILFEEVVKSIEEASRAIDQQKENVNHRLNSSSLKRQAVSKSQKY